LKFTKPLDMDFEKVSPKKEPSEKVSSEKEASENTLK
jgi:hypothetical protein